MRCDPTARERGMLAYRLGATRWVWNGALARRRSAYRCERIRLDGVALSREFTPLRHSSETGWLRELTREPFNPVRRDLQRLDENGFTGRARDLRFYGRRHRKSGRFTLDQRRHQVERGHGEGRGADGAWRAWAGSSGGASRRSRGGCAR
jgi:hypothetical protein